MHPALRIVALVTVATACGILAWRHLVDIHFQPIAANTRPAAPDTSAPLPTIPGWERVHPNVRVKQSAYVRDQLIRLFDGDFAALEREASAPSYGPQGGGTPSSVFYGAFAYAEWNTQPEWERFYHQLDGWSAAHPASPHPGIARATALISHAWEARGGGSAHTVTAEGWRLFKQRLEAAWKALDDADAHGASDYPAAWVARLTIARGLGHPATETLQLAQTAIDRFPQATNLYAETCIYLLPRWHGADGQWESWLKMQATASRWGKDGMPSSLYAHILWRVFGYVNQPIFENQSLSWPKALQGLNQLCAEHPNNDYWKSARARLAAAANDPKTFAEALAAMNGRFDSWAFHTKAFQKALEWSASTQRVDGDKSAP